ncbi:RNA polymerase sigma factor [Sphingomonas montana]|uniref:RNA polymerase sigma factor n=1 Tax=Sphingomonas montana TaxID=1843236 RepID=UPI00096FA981|nr:sigma-70 family RNA polymerase sigma factor [Sphingomonas montana]
MTAGDAQGIEAVLLANRDRLVRFLEARGAGDAAEDVFQELWMKLATHPTGPVGQPLSYLYRAANNLMLDRYRSLRQAALRDHAWADPDGAQDRDDAAIAQSPVTSVERTLIAREELARADAAVTALGPRAATCFRRFRLDGISQKAIAAELGISLSTVESDLRKAYGALVELRRQIDAV